MPIVSSSIIESIREQTNRARNTPYYQEIMDDIKMENPNLYDAMEATLHYMAARCNLDISNDQHLLLITNIKNLCASIYQSIKQQMVCDELEAKIT